MTEQIFKIETKHVELEKYTGVFEIKVNQDVSYKTFYADGVFGCGKNYPTPEAAIRGLITASSTTIISIEKKEADMSIFEFEIVALDEDGYLIERYTESFEAEDTEDAREMAEADGEKCYPEADEIETRLIDVC